jgi:hypothetical protein
MGCGHRRRTAGSELSSSSPLNFRSGTVGGMDRAAAGAAASSDSVLDRGERCGRYDGSDGCFYPSQTWYGMAMGALAIWYRLKVERLLRASRHLVV